MLCCCHVGCLRADDAIAHQLSSLPDNVGGSSWGNWRTQLPSDLCLVEAERDLRLGRLMKRHTEILSCKPLHKSRRASKSDRGEGDGSHHFSAYQALVALTSQAIPRLELPALHLYLCCCSIIPGLLVKT